MAIKLMDTLETAGDFPIINAPSVGLPTGERLDALFDDDGKIKSDSLPSDVGGSDPRLDELLETMFEDGKIREEYLPDIEASDPRVDELLEVAESLFDENGKISEDILPEEKKPESIDLTQYASNGIITENHADGSTVTHTVEFNADGKPVKVTTNGVTTTLTW